MRLLVMLLIFATAYHVPVSSLFNGFNYTLLIEQYYLVCGADYICNMDRIHPRILAPKLQYRNNTNHCPNCFCDDGCLSRGDCCPDIYFSLPVLSCENTTVLHYLQYDIFEPKPHYHLLVNSCPLNANSNVTARCLDDVSIIQHLVSPPVTSHGFPVTYRNKHCALCNSVDKNDFYDWALDIQCNIFVDFNFLSTHEDIIQAGKTNKCRLRYTSPVKQSAAPCDSEWTWKKSWHIGSCNTTGTWRDYDPSIHEACNSHYEVPYRLYKNIFCYMCNPPLSFPGIPIDKCNTTRLWKPRDFGLEMSCELNPSSPYTVPFKNIFCFLCNRINKQTYTYLEAKTKNITEVYNRHKNIYLYKFDIIFLRIEYLYDVYRTYLPEAWSLTNVREDMKKYKIHGIDINITHLAYHHFATFPYDTYCDRDLLPLQYTYKSVEKCSCEDQCLFPQVYEGDKCCLDKALSTPISCVLMKSLRVTEYFNSNLFRHYVANYNTSYRSFLLIDGCGHAQHNPLINDRCGKHGSEDLLSMLPVTLSSKYPYPTSVQYKNIDCLLCRYVLPMYSYLNREALRKILENDNFFDTIDVKAFDVLIKCPNILETGHNVLLYDVIRLAEHINCDVVIAPTRRVPLYCNSYIKRNQSVCNTTGMWQVADAHVQWACENTTGENLLRVNDFKNYFCYMCNPISVAPIVIDKCNASGLWKSYSATVEHACALFPRIHSKPIYKNVFCELCNLNSFTTPRTVFIRLANTKTTEEDVLSKSIYHTYRNMFSVASHNDDEYPLAVGNCTNKQVYDAKQDICRNLTCFPGKILNNRTCVPLLTYTSNLRYTFSVELIGKLNIPGRHINLLRAVQGYFKTIIPQGLNISHIIMDESNLLSNISCSKETNHGTYSRTERQKTEHKDDTALETDTLTDNTTRRETDSMKENTSNFTTESMLYERTEGVQLLMHISFFVGDFVHRADTERTIMGLYTGKHDIPVENEDGVIHMFTVIAEQSLESYITPMLIDQTHFAGRCFIKHTNQTLMPYYKNYNKVYSSKLLLCEQLEFKKHEFTLQRLQMEARVSNIDHVLGFNLFQRMTEGMIRVCLDDVRELTVHASSTTEQFTRKNKLDVALGYVTFVCTVLSMLCLTLTFFVYCLCSQLRTVPGCINMFIIASLFLAQGLFQFGYMFLSIHPYCKIVGIITHLTWLVLFAWMNISSLHMMRVFSGTYIVTSSNKKNNNVLVKYVIYAFGIPILIILSTLVTIGVTSSWSSIGYGGKQICFINHVVAFYVSFLAPVILVCLGNLIFFSITAIKIRQTPNSPKSTGSKKHFDIYVRLFFITGVTWVLVVIDTLLPVSALSFVTTVLNGCQGVYIFVSYVMNRRSFSMVRKQFETLSLRLSNTSESKSSRTSSSKQNHLHN